MHRKLELFDEAVMENSTGCVVGSDICLGNQLLYCSYVKQDSGPHHRKERTQMFADSHRE